MLYGRSQNFSPIIPPVDCAPIFAMSEATSDVDALSSAYACPKMLDFSIKLNFCFCNCKSKKCRVS